MQKHKAILASILILSLFSQSAFAFLPLGADNIIIQNIQSGSGSKQGTYNKTLANNAVINSGGYQINFINGTGNPVNVKNSTNGMVNVTIGLSASAGVSSLNALNGALTIAAVPGNTTVTTSGGNTITINTAYNIATLNLDETFSGTTTMNKLKLGGPMDLNGNTMKSNGHVYTWPSNTGTVCLANQTSSCGTSSSSVTINGHTGSTFTGIIANMTFPAPKITINGNNRSSFISVANTTSANSINGHSVSFPSSNSGTLLLGNGTLSSLTGTLQALLGVTTLSNAGHVSTFPSTTGTLLQANSSGASLTGIVLSSLTNTGHVSTAPLNTGTIRDTNFTVANISTAPSNPTGTTSTTGVMAGVGGTCKITPATTGTVFVIISMQGQSNTGDDGFKADLRISSVAGQTAPSNAAALTGTVLQAGITGQWIASSTTTDTPISPITLAAIASGLTVGSSYWIDIGEYAVTGGTASFTNIKCTAFEL